MFFLFLIPRLGGRIGYFFVYIYIYIFVKILSHNDDCKEGPVDKILSFQPSSTSRGAFLGHPLTPKRRAIHGTSRFMWGQRCLHLEQVSTGKPPHQP